MAEEKKQYTIRIGTEGDASGAREVEKAIDSTTDATRELEQATKTVDSLTSGGTTSITVEFQDAARAAKDLAGAVGDAAKATKDFSDAPALPFVPSKIQPATEAMGDLADAVQDVADQAGKLETIPKTPIKPADVKPAQGSLAALRDELQRLQREIELVPVGGRRFVELGSQIKVAEKGLRDAELQARKLGGSLGRSGGTGLAVLEFSRLLEDAQYGIRGVLNNIPTLLMQLGISGGLAGVVSIVAVAATQMWEAFSNSKDAEQAVDAISAAADKLAKRLGALRDRRKEIDKIPTTDLSKPLTEETTALKLQTEGIRNNIDALKDRVKAQQQLDALLTANDLANVDRAERSGSITPGEAAKQRADIEREAAQRKMAQTEAIAELDETVAKELKGAAERELALAKFRKQSADARLADAEEEERALKAEQRRRAEVDAIRASMVLAQEQFDQLNIGGLSPTAETLRGLLEGADKERRLAEATGGDASNNLTVRLAAALEKMLAAQERLAAADAQGKTRDPNAIAKDTERVTTELEKLKKAVGDAATTISEKEAALALATQSSDNALNRQADQKQDRANVNTVEQLTALQGQLDAAGERSAAEIGKTLEQILASLGDAAKQPAVQAQAAQVREILKDGLQANEEGETYKLLMELANGIRTSDTRRAGLIQQIIQVVQDAGNVDRDLQAQIRGLRTDVNNLKAQQGNPNP